MADYVGKEAAPVASHDATVKRRVSNEIPVERKTSKDLPVERKTTDFSEPPQSPTAEEKNVRWRGFFKPGSAGLIIIAAVLAIVIGVTVSTTETPVPSWVVTILAIPGNLWLRSLRAVGETKTLALWKPAMPLTPASILVLPLIFTAIILAMQRLKEMAQTGKRLAIVTVTYYVSTTILAIVHSTILTALVWSNQIKPASDSVLELSEEDASEYEDRTETKIEDVVVQVFYSFIPNNVVGAFADEALLAVLVTACIVGCLLRPGDGIVRAVHEIDRIVMKVITLLILLAPLGVFFLILPNLFKLDIAIIGENLGFLIGGSLCGMAIQLFVVYPLLFYLFTRKNPFSYWLKCSPAWVTAWGSASSAATMPVTLRMMRERGIPNTVRKFAIPLGTLINMDG
jgi:Na+/serine symporter